MMKTIIAAAASLILAACGVPDQLPQPTKPNQPTKPTDPPWVAKAPTLLVASPSALAVGEELTILGQDFIPASKGSLVIQLKGVYYDDQGKAHPVDLQVKAKRISSTKLTWKLWPNIVFHPQGDRLGSLVGEVKVINVDNDGTQLASPGLPTKIQVKPSLIPRVIRPVNSGCQSVVRDTLEGVGFAFTVEAVGLRDATKENPTVFYWTFMQETWKVGFGGGSFDPDSILPKTGAITVEDRVTEGRSSVVTDGGNRSFLVKVGSDLFGDSRLRELRTKKMDNKNANNYTATVNIAAVDASGKTARLSIPIDVHRMAEMIYDGSSKIAERFPPVMVSDCIPGGDIGRQVSYREDKSESRSRAMSFQYNANAGLNLGLPSNPFALGLNLSAGFGVDVNSSVTTATSKALDISSQILPGQYAVFYRQTTKVYRIGRLVGYSKCGETVNLGDAILTDWIFTPELAHGPTCVPPSRLPKAQKFM